MDDLSSKLDLPRNIETVETLDANHMQMARCSSQNDPRYIAIASVLKQNAGSTLSPREPNNGVLHTKSLKPQQMADGLDRVSESKSIQSKLYLFSERC